MIKEAIIKLSKKENLTYTEAEEVMNEIMEGKASDVQKSAYLTALSMKGETIDVEDLVPAKAKGWHLVCTDGFPLGWGKVTNGTLKNKYLPGWRNQSA